MVVPIHILARDGFADSGLDGSSRRWIFYAVVEEEEGSGAE